MRNASVLLTLFVSFLTTAIFPMPAGATVYFEDAFPKNLSVSIALGAGCVGVSTVPVHVKGDHVKWVVFSNDTLFSEGIWQEFTGEATIDWTLTAGDGEKTVYVLFKSGSQIQSTPIYDSVNVDTTGNCGFPQTVAGDQATEADGSATLTADDEKPFVGNMRGQSFATVYRMGEDGLRRPYMNPTIFATWEAGFEDVTWVPDTELTDYSIGAPVLPQAGVVLVKMMDADKVYWVETDAQGNDVLRWVFSPEVASANFGQNWANSVVDIEPTMFVRYKMGTAITSLEQIDTSKLKTRQELAKRLAP